MASDHERRWNRRPLSPHSHERDKDKDRASPGPAAILTHSDIAQAFLDSPDEGGTLDFSHKNLGDVGESGAEELATIGAGDSNAGSFVLRVALGYNRLSTLPMAFALLTRLRYVNLRANNFATFPDVLTVMPSLEILDISRNKLKRLPSQPGTLLELRVFSISKNKLTRLPEYISKASKLTVFQVDHNPFEWPPKHILEPLENAEDADGMLFCIESVKRWIKDHSLGSLDRLKAPSSARNPSEETSRGTHSTKFLDSDVTSEKPDGYPNFRLPPDENIFPAQHSRSFSTESNTSMYSTVSYESSGSEFPVHKDRDDEVTRPSSPSNPPNIISLSLTSSPPISPTLPDSTTTGDEYIPDMHRVEVQLSNSDNAIYGQQHWRNASYSVAREHNPLTSHLSAKKSLPDLRGSNLTVTDRSRNITNRPRIPDMPIKANINDSGELDIRNSSNLMTPAVDPDTSSPHNSAPADHLAPSHNRAPRLQVANSHIRNPTTVASEPVSPPVMPSPQGPAPPMDVERNSYFRRLSTLPPSTISAALPDALLAMIDSARGIFFAVSQIYQSLRHYTVFAIDDRLSGLLGKVLDPASTYMTHLINALDRFDSVSRRGIPPPAVCRGVLETCRDNVAVFGKVVGVLHLQLKVLAGSDDARYSRSLLLMLYGSMAEISNSWQTMMPHLDAIQPLLSEHRLPPPVAASSKAHTMNTPNANTPNTSSTARNGIPPIPERQPPVTSPIPRASSGTQASNVANGGFRLTRRHAGSFSTRDVQIGKSLPSATEEVPIPSVSSPSPVQPLRSALRKTTATATSHLPPSLPHVQPISASSPSSSVHSRQGSSSPAVAGGNSSTYPLSFSHQLELSGTRSVNSSLEVPSDSSKMVDEDLLNTMEAATETARSVWRMMDEVLHDAKETSHELLESLESAQDITRRLKEQIQAMRGGTTDGDRRAFWEDAHHFVKAVVNVSTILKVFSVSHPFSVMLRSNIAKLTQSTQDFAILLQVSSFSPAPTPSPYSSVIPPAPGKPPAGNISLSRARSAQATLSPTPGAKPRSTELRDVPWSALPHQTFKITENP